MNELKLIDPIKNRYSAITFENKDVEQEKLDLLFEAARWAASSNNEQSWRFIYAHKHQTELYSMLFNCMVEFNKEWSASAPILMLSIAKKSFSINQKHNRFYSYDVGQAVATLSIQATSMGLSIHQMGGFDHEKAKNIFHLSDDFEAQSMIAIGYPGNATKLSGKLLERAQRPRTRKNTEEIFFNEAFVK